jgi:hypothetical protein
MKIQNWCMAVALAGALSMTTTGLLAQQNSQGNEGQRQQRRFDPAQFQERMAERYKEMLEITDDQEWKAVQPLIQKVNETRMQAFAGGGRGMMGFGGGRRSPDGQAGGPPGQGDQPRRFGPPQLPEAETLQKAIDAKAPKAELKAATTKYLEARKAKQAELEKAQENLRKVLTARQEAIAALNGLL